MFQNFMVLALHVAAGVARSTSPIARSANRPFKPPARGIIFA